MTAGKARLPAIEGWFTLDEHEPQLLGTRCPACGTYAFPRQALFCPNASCAGSELDEVPLSRTGTVWSYTVNHYEAPPPYVAPEPFRPYGIAAVELAEERMVVLGQVAEGAESDVRIGARVELVLEPLYEDEEHEYLVWRWKPAPEARP